MVIDKFRRYLVLMIGHDYKNWMKMPLRLKNLKCPRLRQFLPQATMAIMPQQYDFVEHLSTAHNQWNIRVRVVRIWKQPGYKDDPTPGDNLHIIVVDEKVLPPFSPVIDLDGIKTHRASSVVFIGKTNPSNHKTNPR